MSVIRKQRVILTWQIHMSFIILNVIRGVTQLLDFAPLN